MANTKNSSGKKKTKPSKVVLIRLPGKGKIDPKEIRRAVKAVIDERLKAEAEAKAKVEANGKGHVVETE